MDHEWAQAYVEEWHRVWNAHDLDAIMVHYADDVVFSSPTAARLLGTDGVVRGKQALREYWAQGLASIPDLHFEVLGHYVGVDQLVIHHRNQKGNLVCEVLKFRDGLVVEGSGTYADAGNASGAR